MEARDVVEAVLAAIAPSTAGSRQPDPHRPAELRRRLPADALRPPTSKPRALLRHDIDALASRFGVSFEQAAQRLCSLQRTGARGVPFFFLRVDPGRQRQQALLRGRLSVRPLRRQSAPAGSCTAPSPHPARSASRSRNCPTAPPSCASPNASKAPPPPGASRRPRTSSPWAATSPTPRDLVYARRTESGARRRRHRAFLPAVRPPELPQPRVSAAGAPFGSGSEFGWGFTLSVRSKEIGKARALPWTRWGLRPQTPIALRGLS